MAYIDELLENVRSEEDKNLDSITLARFMRRSYIYRTSELIDPKAVNTSISSIAFKPSIIFKYLISSLILIVWMIILQAIAEQNATDVSGAFVICIFLFLTIAVVNHVHLIDFDKTRNYNIQIDKNGIKIGEFQYNWTDIRDTAFLYLPIRRDGITYLVIIFKDETYKKFDLSNFRSLGGFKRKLSGYIDHFKWIGSR